MRESGGFVAPTHSFPAAPGAIEFISAQSECDAKASRGMRLLLRAFYCGLEARVCLLVSRRSLRRLLGQKRRDSNRRIANVHTHACFCMCVSAENSTSEEDVHTHAHTCCFWWCAGKTPPPLIREDLIMIDKDEMPPKVFAV